MAIVGTTKLALPGRHRPAIGAAARRGDGEACSSGCSSSPASNQPVGLDVILDLVPVVGDIAAAALGAYIVWEATQSRHVQVADDADGRKRRRRLAARAIFVPSSASIPDFFFPLEHAQSARSSSATSTSITPTRRRLRDEVTSRS